MTCLAVCAAMRPKPSGVSSMISIWSSYSTSRVERDVRGLRDDDLAGLRVDAALALAGGLRLDLVEEVVLEVLGDDQRLDAELAVVGVQVTRA